MTRRTGMRPLRIAMIGQKSIPARYGGVETHVENVAVRLAKRGHDVSVFCRSRLKGAGPGDLNGSGRYQGVRLLYRPSLNTKHMDAASHTFLCALEAGLLHDFDIIHFHGIGPAGFAPITRMFGKRVVSTFHALDWRQVKWGERARGFLRRGEARGARASDGVIAVSRIMQRHIRDTHGMESVYIPNGATVAPPRGPEGLQRWGLKGNDYILSVGRIIPDREYHTLLEAFRELDTPWRLVVVGTETPRSAYTEALEYMADDRVIFTGDLFGDALEELYANCRLYVLASRVEGLPITVCEAMAHGKPCLLSDIPENTEVGGEAAVYFRCGDVNHLHETLTRVLDDTAGLERAGAAGRERVDASYNWDVIAAQVESFYFRVLSRE